MTVKVSEDIKKKKKNKKKENQRLGKKLKRTFIKQTGVTPNIITRFGLNWFLEKIRLFLITFIFIIQGFSTIVFMFIFTMFRLICFLAFFRCFFELINLHGTTYLVLYLIHGGVTWSDSVNKNWV